jgi:hypothetical protein
MLIIHMPRTILRGALSYPESSAAPGPRLGGTEVASVPLASDFQSCYLLGWGV